MPVIVNNRPDGSKEIISRPSVLIKDPETGEMKRAPTTRSIIPASNSVETVQTPVAAAIMPKGNDRSLVTPAPATFDNSGLGGTNNQDVITGNIALLGTLLSKAVQFFTRSGSSKAAAPIPRNSGLGGAQQEAARVEGDLLPPELKKIVTASPKELEEMVSLNKTSEYMEDVKELKKKLDLGKKKDKNKGENENPLKGIKKKLKKRGIEV